MGMDATGDGEVDWHTTMKNGEPTERQAQFVLVAQDKIGYNTVSDSHLARHYSGS